MAENWQIQMVACLSGGVSGTRPESRVALIAMTTPTGRQEVLRMFDEPAGFATSAAAILNDFQRLLRIPGGSSSFGFVLRERPAPEQPLAPHLHNPAVVGRRGNLSDYGATTTLSDLFEIRLSTLRQGDLQWEGDERGPVAHRVLSGRDIRRDHSVAAPDEFSKWTDNTDCATQTGDIAVRAVYDLNGPEEGFVWARIEAENTPSVPNPNVIMLRPRVGVSTRQLDFVLRYLSSRHVMELSEDPRVGSFRRLHESTLSTWRVPLPDEPLSDAINEVESVRLRVAQWVEEADDIIESLFDDDSATLSRQRVIERSRNVRLRMTAIGNIETLSGRVRTQYPLPIAYSWRILEVARSNGASREAYLAMLDAAEHILAFTAGVGLALAREVGQPVSAANDIATARLARRQGPSMSDWCNVLDELAGQSFADIDVAISTTEFRDFCRNPRNKEARRNLVNRRNDEAHQRRVEEVNISTACDEALDNLEVLLEALTFYLDNTLIIPTTVRWDTFKQSGDLGYRRLAGDHPIVPTQQMPVRTPAVEIGSLYLLDSNAALHLLRPYLVGRNCETCGTFSVFHVDRFLDGVLTLKSIEHGHVVNASSEIVEAVRAVGLLPRT
jgi:hypothetical protein